MPRRSHVWSRRSTAPHSLGARAPVPVPAPDLLGGIVGGVADTVGDVASPVVSDVASVVAGAASVVGSVASEATSVVDKVASPVVAEATKVVDAVTSAVGVVASPVVSDVTKAVDAVTSAVGAVASPIISDVNSVVSDVTKVAGPVVSELTSIAGPVVSELSSAIAPVISEATSVVGDLTSAAAPIVTVVTSVAGDLTSIAHPVVSVLTSVAQPVISVVSSAAQPVISAASSDLSGILSTVTSEVGTIAPPVATVLSSLSSVVDGPTQTRGNGDPPGTTATASNDSSPAAPKATATTDQDTSTSADAPSQTGASSTDVGSIFPSASSTFDSASLMSVTLTLESSAGEGPVVVTINGSTRVIPNYIFHSTGVSFSETSSGLHSFPTTLTVGPDKEGNGNSNGSGSNNGSDPVSKGSSGSAKSHLSPGIIAAIAVVVGLGFFILLIFVVRRCYRKRRAERFQRWTERGGFTFLIGGNHSEKGAAAATASPRSSFGTSHDHGERPFTPEPMPPSPFAPLGTASSASGFSHFYSAREGMTPDSTMGGHGATVMPPMQPEVVLGHSSELSSHFSIGSETGEGEGVDANAQYLVAPQMQEANMAQLSPISVRPWSPSERWAFPKPPGNPSSDTAAAAADVAALERVATPTTASTIKASDTQAQAQAQASLLVPAPASRNQPENDPFADPDSEHESVTGNVRRASASSALSAHSSASANSYLTASSGEGDALAGVLETIKRPFAPTLGDEVAVRRGEQIRILRSFDDGWAQIEKIGTEERGLIPIDCLREAGEALPSFLAARRVSSYGVPSA